MYAYPAGGSTGDDDVFTAMCERHRARLVAFCGRRLRTSHDAEDAAHEVLLRAYRALPAFDNSSDAWPWLRTIAARVCTDLQRRAARTPTPAVLDRHVDDDVHEQVVGRLRADILDNALGQLPPRYRMPLLLKEYGGWTYDDIARTQGKSLSSVRSLLTRSRRRLGTHVESVARERGQWPLPGVVPPIRRLRTQLRSWRSGLDRSGHAMLSAFDLSSVVSRWLIGANATLASMLTFTAAAAAGVLPAAETSSLLVGASPAAVTVGLRESEPASVELQTASVSASATMPMTPPEPETFTRFDATAPMPQDYNPGIDWAGDVGVTGNDDHLWIRFDHTVTLPGENQELNGTVETNFPCSNVEYTVFCSLARTVLPQLPEP